MSYTLDFDFLTRMMDGNEAMVQKFVGIFKNQCPVQLLELKQHLQNQDWMALSNTSHSLKSQFSYLGLEILSAKAAEIETMADQEQTDGLEEKILFLEKEGQALLQSLS